MQWVELRVMMMVTIAPMMVFLRFDGSSYADFAISGAWSLFMHSNKLCQRRSIVGMVMVPYGLGRKGNPTHRWKVCCEWSLEEPGSVGGVRYGAAPAMQEGYRLAMVVLSDSASNLEETCSGSVSCVKRYI